MIIQQQLQNKPEPKKRKGKFKKSRLGKPSKEARSGQRVISKPSDFRHNITVKPEPVTLTRYHHHSSASSPDTPPASPSLPRLRAYASE